MRRKYWIQLDHKRETLSIFHLTGLRPVGQDVRGPFASRTAAKNAARAVTQRTGYALYRCPVCRIPYPDPPTPSEPCTTDGCPVGEGSTDPITRADSATEAQEMYAFNYGGGVR